MYCQLFNFPDIAIAISNLSLFFLHSYCCSNFAIAKVGAFNLLASFSWLLFCVICIVFFALYASLFKLFLFSKAIAASCKIVGRVITVKRALMKRSKELIPKIKQRRLRAIIVQ